MYVFQFDKSALSTNLTGNSRTRRYSYDIIFDVEQERMEFSQRQDLAKLVKCEESQIRTI